MAILVRRIGVLMRTFWQRLKRCLPQNSLRCMARMGQRVPRVQQVRLDLQALRVQQDQLVEQVHQVQLVQQDLQDQLALLASQVQLALQVAQAQLDQLGDRKSVV